MAEHGPPIDDADDVDTVTSAVIARMSAEQRAGLVAALSAFNDAGEEPVPAGWD